MALQEMLKDHMDKKLIRPGNPDWTSPIFFRPKGDGSYRPVHNFVKLNKVTRKDHYPLPNIDEILDELNHCKYFSTLDAASGFFQIPMNEGSIGKTGFTCKYGTYEYLVMPMGLTNAPATFQRLMNDVLRNCLGRHALVYVDDIIVFSKTLNEHHSHLQEVLVALREAGITLKRTKCKIGATHIDFLGHHVSGVGIQPQEGKLRQLNTMRDPINAAEVRSFLGFAGYYRRYIPNFARIAEPLVRLTRKDTTWTFDEQERVACAQLKEFLTSAPTLAFFDPGQVQILTTDASTVGLGAILSQSPDGSSANERVVAYASKAVPSTAKNYSATKLEALAVVWACELFRHYLIGRPFHLYTDHAALPYIFNDPKPKGQLARWVERLSIFDFEAHYRRGQDNAADALSRLV
jgi:hypothetical protein